MELICPKCQGSMRSYERNGITVDQCQQCRGIFLDRGELERLVDAENRWHTGPSPEAERGYSQPREHDHRRDDRRHYDDDDHHRHGYGRSGHKRKRSFLDDLFD